MRLFLTGLPTSGKSTIGKALAEELDIPFYDLDHMIEENAGKSIEELFSKGEMMFRMQEEETLRSFLQEKQDNWVMALGGGSFCQPSLHRLLLQSGLVIYLELSWEDWMAQTNLLRESRPLFEGMVAEEAKELQERLWHDRRPFYESAQLKTLVNTGNSAKKLANWLKLLTNRPQSL